MTNSSISEAPEGWTTVSPLEISDLIRGVSYEKGEASTEAGPTKVALLRANNIGEVLSFEGLQYVPEDRVSSVQMLRPGDVVIAMSSGSKSVVGKAASLSVAWQGTFGAFCSVLRASARLDGAYFGMYFRTLEYRSGISDLSAGTSINNLKRDYFDTFQLPVAPLAEQRRIVAKAEALMVEVRATRARLAKVPNILKQFRQTVLAAACSGQLTKSWRESIGREGDDSEANWPVGTIASVCSTIVDCPHTTPKWTSSGTLCFRTSNFLVGGLDLSEVRYVSAETYDERIARLEPTPGDIVYSREGGILGIACVIPPGVKACLGQRMMLMRADSKVILSAYLCHVLNSPAVLTVVKAMTGGTAAPHLNVGDIKAFAVPLPPLDEQHEIVRRIEALFALADSIERRLAIAIARTDKVPQAILAKAFRGELVPTEAELARAEGRDYEPASALLERIRNEREAAGPTAARGRKKTAPEKAPAKDKRPAAR